MTGEPAERRFRPEIEGLRAVAAVLVAVYHVFLGRVSGGVDVFFVIAGFLITASLVGQATGDGVHAGRYLARLAVRLLPIALLVLVAVALATAAWFPVTRQGAAYGEIAASALYVENWALALKAVDYVARDEAKSPVQHFWAMSVQGQFYLAWLVLVAVVARAAGRRRLRTWLGAALAVVFAGSLATSIALTADNQPLAYFHTGARMWEFAAGGLLAIAGPRLAAALTPRLGAFREPVAFAAGWLGLAMIISCGLVLRVSALFPGWAALWPIGGAALVVAAGGAGGRWSAGRLLASPPFVWTGGIAYAIYLWHWPLLVVARTWLGHEGPLEPLPGLAVIAGAVALAAPTTRLVERPVRLRLGSAPRPWAVAGSAAAIMVTLATGTYALGRPPAIPAAEVVPDASAHPGAAAMRPPAAPVGAIAGAGATAPPPDPSAWAEEDADDAWDGEWWTSDDDGDAPAATIPPLTQLDPHRKRVHFIPDLRTAKVDLNAMYAAGCQVGGSQPGLVICERGDPKGKRTALLIGGSHATQWFPPLNRIAKDRGWRLQTALKGSCRFLSGPYGDDADGRSCETWVGLVLDRVRADPPDFVITTGTVTNPRGERLPPGYVDLWRRLNRLGIPVVAIRDTPRAAFDRVECLAVHDRDPEACDIARHPTMDHVSPFLRQQDLPGNLLYVDVTDYLCTADTCPAVIGSVVVYRDCHHLTATYALTLAPMLAEQIPIDPVDAYEARSASR